jgi:peptidoglycan hydrolase-like protein with peptidoglycan-binding domain
MTESTDPVTLNLPHLKRDSNPLPNKGATARVQHIFNDMLKADNKPAIFEESGAFGPTTEEHVSQFQRKNGISPAKGEVGPKTWKALLESWAALRPLKVQLPTHPVD